ncbi:MAG: OmpA family protein [Bacteroidetes bacterium]|nr:OmpA family protein [Bacteroidota bacterium]
MRIRDIFSCWPQFFVFFLLLNCLAGQRESIKFGLPVLDTAITIWPSKQVNNEGAQYSPHFFRNGIIYVHGKKAHPLDYEEGLVFFKLRYADVSPEGEASGAMSFPIQEPFNVHLGPVAYNDSTEMLYISRTYDEEPDSKYSKSGALMHIYAKKWQDSSWKQSVHLAVNDSLSNSFHPTLSSDGKRLIFASDRPENTGSFDLYASEQIDGQWSEPYRLTVLNSKANEAFPFLYEDKYLFFSSDRKGGLGDYDFYFSALRSSGWSKPINIGNPFNSLKDDVGIAIHEDGRKGFFSSSREGVDNIYGFSSSLHLFKEELPDREIQVVAIDDETGMRLDDVKIWDFEQAEDGKILNKEVYQASIMENQNTQGLTVSVDRKSAAAFSQPASETDRNGKTVITIRPEKPKRILVGYKKGFSEIELPLNYFETDSTIQLRFSEIKCLPLEIKAVGPDGGRVKQFDILIRNLSDNQFQEYSLPLTERICIEHNKNYEIIGRKSGSIPDTFRVDAVQEDVKKVAVLFRLIPEMYSKFQDFDKSNISDFKEGVTLELRNIYYDFDRATIRKGAEEELVRLAEIMKKYPEMEIELAAHTDSRGNESYNLKLSQRRAETAKAILTREGVGSNRVEARGYGATKLRNICAKGVPCSEEEHQENRRTEIRILKAPQTIQVEFVPEAKD